VGSFPEDIIPGRTGLICRSRDAFELARAIREYFEGDLFADFAQRRQEIGDYARSRYSWDVVGEETRNVYLQLPGASLS
jgi:glycosyltransferase involved in cell wall biosynthesis